MKEKFLGPSSVFNIGFSYVEADKKESQSHNRLIKMLKRAFKQKRRVQEEAWSVRGFYRTVTTKEGENTIVINGELHAMNLELCEDSKHMVAWVFGNPEDKRSEVLSCTWDP